MDRGRKQCAADEEYSETSSECSNVRENNTKDVCIIARLHPSNKRRIYTVKHKLHCRNETILESRQFS